MAHIMKTNVWQFRFLQELLELIDHMVWSEMRTRERAENVIVILPACACLLPGLFLMQAVLLHGLERERSDGDAPTTELCFWFSLDKHFRSCPGWNTLEDAAYLQDSSREIDVLPLESQQFTLPHACSKRKCIQRLPLMPSSRIEEGLHLLWCERLNLKSHFSRGSDQITDIAWYKPPLHSGTQSIVQDAVIVVDR